MKIMFRLLKMRAREKQLKKEKFLLKQAERQEQEQRSFHASKKNKRKNAKHGAEDENSEDYVDPETPSGFSSTKCDWCPPHWSCSHSSNTGHNDSLAKNVWIHYFGDRYSLSQQVLNFESTLNQYRRMMNATTLSQYLAKSIAVMVSGSNDYINNYLMFALYSSSYNYNAQEFGNLLVNSYVRQILVFEC